ncbi:unnamed protein product [Rhizoctonia solani]|uniref:Uncharacterized protein n=1 Tax=Rhizoctonia solani TaxID=456999 RepID=A0A8H2XLV7_9AGAM|nr:unnamed protein product [Rhizoctonia solani]
MGLEDPIRIQNVEWKQGNPFYDWYSRRSRVKILSMQLRQEQTASPFSHQYLAFKLDDGTYFRIDRRRLPSPMNYARPREEGVEAYDTIEQITGLEDSIYNPSYCLVKSSLSAPSTANLDLLVDACRRIYNDRTLPRPIADSQTHTYTIQRYDCYFYAQTLFICIVFPLYDQPPLDISLWVSLRGTMSIIITDQPYHQ